MNKRFIILIAAIMIILGGCIHPGSNKFDKNEIEDLSAKLNETYPIIGITVSELDAFIQDIKGQLTSDEHIISIGLIVHSSKIQVTTGQIDGPQAGGGFNYIFEKKEKEWVLVNKSIWIS